jgi:hypothetical protein
MKKIILPALLVIAFNRKRWAGAGHAQVAVANLISKVEDGVTSFATI